MTTTDLVRAAQAGDPTGREALARAWLARVYGAALACTGRAADAEDLTQEAFLRAFRRLSDLRQPARFGPWMLRIVRNLHRDVHRRRHGEMSLSQDAAQALEAGAGEPAGVGEVLEAWRALREDERLVCWLKIVDGMPFRDIGELMGLSKSAVHRIYGKGLTQLRKGRVSC